MAAPRRLRLTATFGVLLALIGVWLGHTVEYVRVWGTAGIDRALAGPAHAYMIPVGVMLAVAAALAARRAWSVWQSLASRLDRAARQLRLALRGGRPEPAPAPGLAGVTPSWQARILTLAGALAVIQVAVYVLQENLEAVAMHQPAPGLGAITGVHWAAALIQLDVALLLLAAAVTLLRRLRIRVAAIISVESVLRLLSATLRPEPVPRPRAARLTAPLDERIGHCLWSRPPPFPA
jgi:hypothetical protein